MSTQPILFTWDGDVMVPWRRFTNTCNKQYVVGENYRLGEIEERSMQSHRHEFAWLREAWMQLPEDIADLYPTEEHLRKRALIEAGYYHEQAVDAGSNDVAIRVAEAFRIREEFSLVIINGPAVLIRTAKSQSRRAMKRQEFQESKTAIMEIIAAMIGVTPDQLQKHSAPPIASDEGNTVPFEDCQREYV